MKTLELNQLKNYLGTGLRIAKDVDPSGSKECYEDSGQLTTLVYESAFGKFGLSDVIKGETIHGVKIKPLMHPLSMLTEEIEYPVTGEKFVPVVELVKFITQSGYDVENISEYHYDNIQQVVTVVFKSIQHPNSKLVLNRMFEIDLDDLCFSVLTMDSQNEVNYYLTGNIEQMRSKLLEWHFWIFDQEDFGTLVIDKSKM